MAERRPLVLIDGRHHSLPQGDTLAGVSGVSTWKEPVSVFNGDSPQIVFMADGDAVMCEVA